jgi:hypothetical protein
VSALILVAACHRASHRPPEGTKIAVVEFSVADNAQIEDYDGPLDGVGTTIAEAIAEKLRDHRYEAQAIPKTTAPVGDLIVSGEITNLDGGNTAAQLLVGFGAGATVVGVQGHVLRADGTTAGIFSEERIGSGLGERRGVAAAARRVGAQIGDMIAEGEYRGGRPGSHGYLAPAKETQERPPPATVTQRLDELDRLHEQRRITDEEYQKKRREVLDDL